MHLAIRTRLTLWYAAVLTLILIAVSVFLVWRLRSDLLRAVDSAIATTARQSVAALEDPTDEKERLDLEELTHSPPDKGTIIQVLAPDGGLISSVGDQVDGPVGKPEGRVSSSNLTIDGTTYRALFMRLSRTPNILVVAGSTEPVDRTTGRLLVLLAIAIPAGVALSVLGGYGLARRALRPIDRMTRDAESIGSADDGRRIDAPALDDELGRLGRTLNTMLDGLRSSVDEQRRFTADASHELRTPLAIMQSEIDVAVRSPDTPAEAKVVLQSTREEVARMTRIVENLLALALSDEGRMQLDRSAVDVGALAKEIAHRFEHTAKMRESRVLIEVATDVVARADRHRLDQLLSNLVDNAIKHSPRDGTVRVVVEREDGSVRIDVADEGPGIPASDIERVFDRFYRVEQARARRDGGAGLGLAICRSIARAHGGEIGAANLNGAGCVFTVRLPLAGIDFG